MFVHFDYPVFQPSSYIDSFEGEATASKKKRAKQLAAKEVLEQMQQTLGERAIA